MENLPGVHRELQVPFLIGGDMGRDVSGRRWGSFGSQSSRALNITLLDHLSNILCLLLMNLQYLPVTSVMQRKHLGLTFKTLSGLCPISIYIFTVSLHTVHSSQVIFSLPIEKLF